MPDGSRMLHGVRRSHMSERHRGYGCLLRDHLAA
jgi:hypothetical protein